MTGRGSRGTLFLVVGPSGAGKDTLIAQAAARRPDLWVPQRVVTRAADAGGEPIMAVGDAAFDALEAAGGFMLAWRAHGLAYGIPVEAAAALARGESVLVNVSRAVVAEARQRFAPVRVLVIDAPVEVLARRLAQRGRETASDIAARLARAGSAPQPAGPDVRVIVNDGPIEAAVEAFLEALQPESA
ncbi:MAG: phosphonate metabolism protein/1,5-bisphosphokinase (PRPP-forming) PhnN [Pikeienuella sp.]